MCEHCDYSEYLDTIDEMLDNFNYDFAMDTLSSIQEWILDNEHITERQKIAIENIRDSKRDIED